MDATCVPWPYLSVASGDGGEVLLRDDLVLEVRVGRVDTGVEDGDLDALAVEPGGPGLVGADLLDGLVEAGLADAVEPHVGDAGGGPRVAGRVSVTASHRSGASCLGVRTASAFSDLRVRRTLVSPASRTSAFAAAAAPLVADDQLEALLLGLAVGRPC